MMVSFTELHRFMPVCTIVKYQHLIQKSLRPGKSKEGTSKECHHWWPHTKTT